MSAQTSKPTGEGERPALYAACLEAKEAIDEKVGAGGVFVQVHQVADRGVLATVGRMLAKRQA